MGTLGDVPTLQPQPGNKVHGPSTQEVNEGSLGTGAEVVPTSRSSGHLTVGPALKRELIKQRGVAAAEQQKCRTPRERAKASSAPEAPQRNRTRDLVSILNRKTPLLSFIPAPEPYPVTATVLIGARALGYALFWSSTHLPKIGLARLRDPSYDPLVWCLMIRDDRKIPHLEGLFGVPPLPTDPDQLRGTQHRQPSSTSFSLQPGMRIGTSNCRPANWSHKELAT